MVHFGWAGRRSDDAAHFSETTRLMRFEQNPSVILPFLFSALALSAANGCGNGEPMAPGASTTAGAGGTGGSAATTGAGNSATAGTIARAGNTATGAAGISGRSGTAGSSIAGTSSAGTGAGTTSAAGSGAATAGTGAPMTAARPEPSIRNPKYMSLAPALGEALPKMNPGAWTW